MHDRAREHASDFLIYIYIYKFTRDNNTDMLDRGPRFNLFIARVCRTDYATLSFSLILSFSLSLSLLLFLSLLSLSFVRLISLMVTRM